MKKTNDMNTCLSSNPGFTAGDDINITVMDTRLWKIVLHKMLFKPSPVIVSNYKVLTATQTTIEYKDMKNKNINIMKNKFRQHHVKFYNQHDKRTMFQNTSAEYVNVDDWDKLNSEYIRTRIVFVFTLLIYTGILGLACYIT